MRTAALNFSVAALGNVGAWVFSSEAGKWFAGVCTGVWMIAQTVDIIRHPRRR